MLRKPVALLLLSLCGVAAQAEVVIRVVDAAGKAVPNAYLGVVRDDAAWRQPAAEQIAGSGEAKLDVPPGTYRIAAGAKGFATYYGEAMRLDAAREVTVRLERLGSVAGRVVAAGGSPIGGARVGMFWAFLSDYPRRLSDMGESLLRSNEIAVTDADGVFELPAAVGHSTFVVVEADGKAPRIIDGVSAGSDALRSVTLDDGAALRVDVEGIEDRGGWLQLVPASTQIPRERAITLWTKPVAATVTWPALPATKYDLLFLPEDGADSVASVASFVLERGGVRRLRADLPRLEHATPPSTTVKFVLTDRPAGEGRFRVSRWTASGPEPAPSRLRHASGGDIVEVHAPCAAGDRFLIEGERSFGAVAIVSANDCANAPTVPLQERAALRLHVIAPRNAPMPRAGLAIFSDCKSKHSIAEVPFAIRESVATLVTPARCVSLLATLRPFAPLRVPQVSLDAGNEHDLGEWKLVPGGAIVAHVSQPDGSPAANVHVTAYRADDLLPLRDVRELEAVPPLARGVTDAKGWVSLGGMPEGSAILMLRPGGREYPQLSDLIKVAGDERHTLDVILEAPARLTVAVERPKGLSAVDVRSFDLVPSRENRWPESLMFRERAASDGSAAFKSVPPGRWQIRAIGGVANAASMILGTTDIEVTQGARLTESVPLRVIVVRGHVTRGGNGVEGILTLKPLDGKQSPLTTKTAGDGAFTTLVAVPGDYEAVVGELTGQTLSARDPVQITGSRDDLEIALPSGRIEGVVIGEDGAPVATARIRGVAAIDRAPFHTEAHSVSLKDGTFVIDGVRDGQWAVTASTDDGLTSEPVQLSLAAGEMHRGTTLRVRAKTKLTGKVILPDARPAVDAMVFVSFPPPFTNVPSGLSGRVDEHGEFALFPPPGAPDVGNLLVVTPDHILVPRRSRVADGMTLLVPGAVGAVRLKRSSGKWTYNGAAFHLLVASDGSFFSPFNGGSIEGSLLTTARVPAQQYRYVVARSAADIAEVQGGRGASLPTIATMTVVANSVTEVSIDDAAFQ